MREGGAGKKRRGDFLLICGNILYCFRKRIGSGGPCGLQNRGEAVMPSPVGSIPTPSVFLWKKRFAVSIRRIFVIQKSALMAGVLVVAVAGANLVYMSRAYS